MVIPGCFGPKGDPAYDAVRDASLVTRRSAPCVAGALSMTVGEVLALAHPTAAGWGTHSDMA
jgi:hypothetical protein